MYDGRATFCIELYPSSSGLVIRLCPRVTKVFMLHPTGVQSKCTSRSTRIHDTQDATNRPGSSPPDCSGNELNLDAIPFLAYNDPSPETFTLYSGHGFAVHHAPLFLSFPQ